MVEGGCIPGVSDVDAMKDVVVTYAANAWPSVTHGDMEGSNDASVCAEYAAFVEARAGEAMI